MADTKLQDLTEDATPGGDSLLYTVDDPAGTPADRKTEVRDILAGILTGTGDLPYQSATALTRLGIGIAGQVLTVNSGATAPEWADAAGGGAGNTRVQVIKALPPAANAATLDTAAGGSTPAENYQVWDFDPTTVEYMDFLCRLGDSYAGGGLTFKIAWSADAVATGNVVWEIAIRAIPADTEDVDTSHTYVYNQVIDAAPSVDGEVVYATVAFTDGADMDSWAAGELAIVRVRRLATDASDTMNSNDAELWALSGVET